MCVFEREGKREKREIKKKRQSKRETGLIDCEYCSQTIVFILFDIFVAIVIAVTKMPIEFLAPCKCRHLGNDPLCGVSLGFYGFVLKRGAFGRSGPLL